MLATLKPPAITFAARVWCIPHPRDRCRVRGAYRALRRCGLRPLDARCIVIDLLCAGMNSRELATEVAA